MSRNIFFPCLIGIFFARDKGHSNTERNCLLKPINTKGAFGWKMIIKKYPDITTVSSRDTYKYYKSVSQQHSHLVSQSIRNAVNYHGLNLFDRIAFFLYQKTNL